MKSRLLHFGIILAAVAVFILLGLLVRGQENSRRTEDFRRRPSVVYTDESGARAIYLVLKKYIDAEPLRRPLTAMPSARHEPSIFDDEDDEDDDAPFGSRPRRSSYSYSRRNRGQTLIIASPTERLSADEARALRSWVDSGGQLILAASSDWDIAGAGGYGFLAREKITIHSGHATSRAERVVDVAGLPTRRFNLDLPKDCRVAGPRETGTITHFSGLSTPDTPDDDRTPSSTILDFALGEGRIVVIPDDWFLSNKSLKKGDNAALLVQLALRNDGRKVFFDEYHHRFAEQAGFFDLTWALAVTPWGWALETTLLAGLLYVFGVRRRFGRIREPASPSRQSPLDLVDARAALYRVTSARSLAIEGICLNLEAELARSMGRSVTIAALAATGLGGERSRLQLARLNEIWQKARQGRALVDAAEVSEAACLAGAIFEENAVE